MKEMAAQIVTKWQGFLDVYGWYIVAFLLGVLVAAGIWMVKHPEDFFIIEEEDKENEKPVRADK